MPFSNYAELLDSIKGWTWERNDLAQRAPDCVALAEADFNNMLRLGQMEAETSITLTAGVGALPVDYLQWRVVKTQDTPLRVLQYAEPNWAENRYSPLTATLSNHFTIIGSSIKTFPISPSSIMLRYYQAIPPLASNPSGNWLLRQSPQSYLYAALVHMAPFLDDDERIATWGALRKASLEQLVDSDRLARFAKIVQRPDSPTP